MPSPEGTVSTQMFSCRGEVCSPHFVYLVILYLYVLLDIYFILWLIIHCNFSFSQIAPALVIGSSFSWLHCPFDRSHFVGLCFCFSSSLHLVVSCPSHFTYLSRDSWFLLLKNGVRAKIWALGVPVAVGCCSRPSQRTEQGHLCVGVDLRTHTWPSV